MLERAILEWYIARYADTPIKDQLKSAKFLEREWTKVGFYVEFDVEKNPKILLAEKGINIPINGPYLKSPSLEHGGGTLLWANDGFLNCIEMFAYGDFFPEIVSEFELVEPFIGEPQAKS